MRNAIFVSVKKCSRAEVYNKETMKKEFKKTKDGEPVYSLFYLKENYNPELDFTETTVEKISSLIELEPGDYLLEVEIFSINNKIYYRVISNLKTQK